MEKIRYVARKMAALFAVLVVGLSCFTIAPVAIPAYAEGERALDETYVIEDLGAEAVEALSATSPNQPILHTVSEYGYSNYATVRNENYALYLYVYDPDRTTYVDRVGANTVTMATSYENGKPSDYSVLRLMNCGYTTGKYDRLVYKFRVLDLDDVVENVVKMQKEKRERSYDIGALTLLEEGKTTAKTYDVGTTYHFSGFAEGCDPTSTYGSTLTSRWSYLETINLDVKHFNYRTGDYNKHNICDELNTVYFAVDNDYFEKYGGLQKIKAQWYEYKTNPVFITSDESAYDALIQYLNYDIGKGFGDLHWRVVWDEHSAALIGDPTDEDRHFDSVYNQTMGNDNTDDGFLWCESYYWGNDSTNWIEIGDCPNEYEIISKIDWLFYRKNVDSRSDYRVSTQEVEEYMNWYTNQFSNQEKILDKYAKGLFTESIDSARLGLLEDPTQTSGKIVQEIDAGDKSSLTFKKEQSWWDKFWNGVKYEEKSYDPIVLLDDSIRLMTPETFASVYLVDTSQAETVYDDCLAILNKGQTPVLFRFALTEYYASTARFDYAEEKGGESDAEMSDKDGYVAQETVFLDFTIITLTFRKEGVDTVIPAVASPIDIINGFTPSDGLDAPSSGCNDVVSTIKVIMALVIVIVLIGLVGRLIRWVIRPWIGKK